MCPGDPEGAYFYDTAGHIVFNGPGRIEFSGRQLSGVAPESVSPFFYQVFFRLYCATLDCFSLILSFSVAWCYAEQLSLFQVRNEDADSFLSKMATSIFPLGIILVGTAVVRCLMDSLFHACLPELIETFLTAVFLRLQINTSRIVTGIFYTVSLHLLWFFGIHGSHVFFEINEVFLKNLLHRPSVYKDYTTLELTCADTGIGMDEEFKNKMFQPFVRDAKTEVREVEGNGLGLEIVKNIIDGEIYVDSEVGKGTTFTIVLHLKDDKDTVSSPDPEQPWKQEDICNLEGRRILLVEDNELNREIAVEFLAMTGAEIEEAVNGKQAVERMEASPPHYYDLILMDIQMPEMNGCEAAKRIRKLEREDSDLPIIAMTANAFSDDIRMTKEAGMNEHISKPIDLPKLYQVLGRFLKT